MPFDQEKGAKSDTSLRAKSLARARKLDVPRTLTPYEWQAWYEVNGVPDSHRVVNKSKRGALWDSLASWVKARKVH